jgi:S-adenosylmethionine decarboxylase
MNWGMVMLRLLLGLLMFGQILSGEEYRFSGKHFVASYLDCDLRAMSDLEGLIRAMDEAVGSSGATILDKCSYVFPPNGLTIVHLLSESHASLHTYPEHGACFVDLFTCGERCSAEKFDAALRDYLKPNRVSAELFHRGEGELKAIGWSHLAKP